MDLEDKNLPRPIKELIRGGNVESVVWSSPLNFIVKCKPKGGDQFDNYEICRFKKKSDI